jgi:hypothetical protein
MNHFQIQVDPNRYLSRSLNSSSTSEHFVENNNNSEVKNKLKLSGANGNSRIITSHDSRQNRLEYEEQELSDAAISRSRSKSISYGDKIKDLSLWSSLNHQRYKERLVFRKGTDWCEIIWKHHVDFHYDNIYCTASCIIISQNYNI